MSLGAKGGAKICFTVAKSKKSLNIVVTTTMFCLSWELKLRRRHQHGWSPGTRYRSINLVVMAVMTFLLVRVFLKS